MGKHIVMYDPGTADEWIDAIRQKVSACYEQREDSLCLSMTVHFVFRRPKSHFRSGRNAHLLKDSAPDKHTSKPDLDNAIKLVCDTLGTPKKPLVYSDDSCVVTIIASKRWAKPDEPSGMRLLLNEVRDQAEVQPLDPS